MEYESRKRKNVKSFHIHEGEEVLKANKRKEGRKGGRLEGNWTGPFIVKDITGKGVATLEDKSGKHSPPENQCVPTQTIPAA